MITVDLKIGIIKDRKIWWIIDAFSKYAKGVVLKTKTAEEVVQGLKDGWFWMVWAPRSGVWGDNRTEFANGKMEELCKVWGIKFAAGAPYSP